MENTFAGILGRFGLEAADLLKAQASGLGDDSILRLNFVVKTSGLLLLVRELWQEGDIMTQSREVGEWTHLSLLWGGRDFKQMFGHSAADLLEVALDKLGFMLNSVAIYDTLEGARLLPMVERRVLGDMDWVEFYLLFDFGDSAVKVELPEWIYTDFCGAGIGELGALGLREAAALLPHLG